jgi:hypothetical protein
MSDGKKISKKILIAGGVVITAGMMLGGGLTACNTPEAEAAVEAPAGDIDTWEDMSEDMGMIIGG